MARFYHRRRNMSGYNAEALGGDELTYLLDDATLYTLSDASLYVAGDARSRAAGLALYQLAQRASSGGSNADDSPFAGWAINNTPSGTSDLDDGFVFDASSVLEEGRGAALTIGSQTEGADQHLITVLRNQGAYLYQRVGGIWTLLWVEANGATQTLYDAFYMPATLRRPGTLSRRRIAALPSNATYPVTALGVRDLDLCTPGTGTGTSSIVTPAAGNTFVGTADVLKTYVATTRPSSGTIQTTLRQQDASNRYLVQVFSNGNAILYEVVSGTPTARGSANGAVSDGDIVAVKAMNETITGYAASAEMWTYALAANFKTATGGAVLSLGTGGQINNLKLRTLDGVANVSSSNHPGYGSATGVFAGPLVANDEVTRELAMWGEITIASVPTSGTLEYAIRYLDANNYVYLEVDTSGNFDLRQVTAGGASVSLATNAAGISGGERLVFIDTGSAIRILHGEIDSINQATSLHNTATLTRALTLGTAGELHNATNYPLKPGSALTTPESSVIKSAFDLFTS